MAAQEAEEPELTWAPLTTPPPLVEPPFWSPTDQVDGFAMGDPNAPVVIEVWEDFQCPYCQRFTYEVEPGIVETYVNNGDVRLVFRHLAFLGDESHWAAVAASLAADQNMFWPFKDYLFANFQGNESGGFHIDRLLEMGFLPDEIKTAEIFAPGPTVVQVTYTEPVSAATAELAAHYTLAGVLTALGEPLLYLQLCVLLFPALTIAVLLLQRWLLRRGFRRVDAVRADIRRLETEVSEKLGAKVRLDHGKKGSGKLVISYNNLDELDGILKHIK